VVILLVTTFGASLSLKNARGETPLDLAHHSGYEAAYEALLRLGGDHSHEHHPVTKKTSRNNAASLEDTPQSVADTGAHSSKPPALAV
jgi:ankyrin repeat protein